MGTKVGFDMVPRLSNGQADQKSWQSFIESTLDNCPDDDLVQERSDYIEFKVGKHLLLPWEGHKFLRFGSNTSGSLPPGVEEVIDDVAERAEYWFGSRIRRWNEAADEPGFYGWPEVHASVASYGQRGEVETPTTIAEALSGVDYASELGLPLFEVETVPGKGKGLIARFHIPKGTRILCEKPILTTPKPLSIPQLETDVGEKLETLSETEHEQFFCLSNNFPDNPLSGIVKTNALPCGPDSLIDGIFPNICLINHSCLPNAHNNWNSEMKCQTIHAIRSIQVGEEITISYDKGGSSVTRLNYLDNAFGFSCECEICSSCNRLLQASDSRRRQIQNSETLISDANQLMVQPEESLADCHSLHQLLWEEFEGRAGERFARLYYNAFQICITHGDQARASIFAGRARKMRAICEGEDSSETQKMDSLAKNPEEHSYYGVSTRW